MDNLSGTHPFLDHFLQDPLEAFQVEQKISIPQHDEPFMLIPIVQTPSNKNPKWIAAEHCRKFSVNDLEMLIPENLKVIVGTYTFALSSHLKIGMSARDGVDVFVGYNQNGGTVAAKQCIRRAPLTLPQILGPVNKSNLVRMLDIRMLDHHSFVMIMEMCKCNLRTFLTSDVYKECNLSLTKRMCFEFLSGLNVLHSNNIIHNNLKPENVLIGSDGILKIADYPVISNWTEFMKQQPCRNPERLCWEATEVKKRLHRHSAHKSDIQVGGMLLHLILCNGVHPFGPLSSPITVDSNIRSGQYSIVSTEKEAKHLISWMLPAEPGTRKDTNTCITHPFFWNRKKRMKFMAAVGRQPEIRSGYRTSVLEQINELAQWLNIPDWRQDMDAQVMQIMSSRMSDSQYGSSVGDLLRIISDIHDMTAVPETLADKIGDVHKYITEQFAPFILPIYDIVIKSALCLRPQLERVIHMTTKSPETV